MPETDLVIPGNFSMEQFDDLRTTLGSKVIHKEEERLLSKGQVKQMVQPPCYKILLHHLSKKHLRFASAASPNSLTAFRQQPVVAFASHPRLLTPEPHRNQTGKADEITQINTDNLPFALSRVANQNCERCRSEWGFINEPRF